MPFGGGADMIDGGSTLAPPCEYDWTIHARGDVVLCRCQIVMPLSALSDAVILLCAARAEAAKPCSGGRCASSAAHDMRAA